MINMLFGVNEAVRTKQINKVGNERIEESEVRTGVERVRNRKRRTE